jgi:anaerobic magnesium-protoporphyrin IX monomethyl ester cyclase
VAYDNDSYMHWFPQGLGYLASVIRGEGHEVSVWSQDVGHWSDTSITGYLDDSDFDVVGVGVVGGYYQYRKLLGLSKAIRAAKRKVHYVIGGHGPSPEPEYFLEVTGADAVVVGEGERAVLDALWDCGVFRSSLIEDVDSIPFPAYDLFPMEYYRLLRMPHCTARDFVMPVLGGRGCPYRCNFCYRMDEGFRPRKTEAILEEIRMLQKRYGVTYVAFSDELLMSSVGRMEDFCEGVLSSGMTFKWDCNGRLNYAKPDILELMKQAGCVYINYGIEAVDDEILQNMNKNLTVDMIHRGIEATLAAGISPGFNIIWGNLGETKETLEKGVEFLLKYDDGADMRTIRPVTAYPGSDLYYRAIEMGFLEGAKDFYENKHVNSDLVAVNFTNLSDADFHKCLLDANTRLIRNYFEKKMDRVILQAIELYSGNPDFRGFR